jgi:hypothetical protein
MWWSQANVNVGPYCSQSPWLDDVDVLGERVRKGGCKFLC